MDYGGGTPAGIVHRPGFPDISAHDFNSEFFQIRSCAPVKAFDFAAIQFNQLPDNPVSKKTAAAENGNCFSRPVH
jgi:hypothetical protein